MLRRTVLGALILCVALSACQAPSGPQDTAPNTAPNTAPKSEPAADTHQAAQTQPGGTQQQPSAQMDAKNGAPPATQPPATQPPATQPPATQPVNPPATQPPATQPPPLVQQPPVDPAAIYGLQYVPADTPYVLAMLRPIPYEEWPMSLESMAPLFDELKRQLKLNPGDPDALDTKLLLAYLKAFDGKLNKAGLEALGFSLEARVIIYGLGPFPVLRFEIKSGEKLRALIEQIEKDAGVSLERATISGHAVMVVSAATLDLPWDLLIAIRDTEVILTLAPKKAQTPLMSHLLSDATPPTPLSPQTLLDQAAKHRPGRPNVAMVGLVRARELIQLFAAQGDALTQTMYTAAFGSAAPLLDTACKAELERFALWLPQLVLTADVIPGYQDFELVFEISDAPLLAELMLWRYPTPNLGQPLRRPGATPPLFVMAAGLDLARMFSTLKTRSAALASAKFDCAFLRELPAEASAFSASVDLSVLPPEVQAIKGFFFQLTEMTFSAHSGPSNISGIGLVMSEKPAALWSYAALLDSSLSGALPPDGTPKSFPVPAMLRGSASALYAALTANALGVAVGKGQDAALIDLLKAPAASEPPLLSFAYDYGRFMSLFSSLDPSLGTTAGAAFSFIRWFATFDIGVRASGFYMRAALETNR